MALRLISSVLQGERDAGYLHNKNGSVRQDYFSPPHGDNPPSDEVVHAATHRYIVEVAREEFERSLIESARRVRMRMEVKERLARFPKSWHNARAREREREEFLRR